MIRTRTPGTPARAARPVEADLLARYARVLEEEYAALLAADEVGIARLTIEKSALLEPLAALHTPVQADARAQVARLVRQQRRNGRLISERLADVQRQLAFFAAATPETPRAGTSAATYGRGGVEYLAPQARLSTRI